MISMDRLSVVCMGCWLAVPGGMAAAQTYPVKSIRVVVPFAPGGATDITGRLAAQKITEAWGQNMIIDNRPGASGMIGADIVAKAPSDGYTVLLGSTAELAINQHLYSKMAYSTEKDLAPVTLAAVTPLILVIHPSIPAKSVQELIRLAKARPGQLTYASAGTGGVQHLAGELLKTTAGINIIHVPYKGAGPAIGDLLGGQVSMFFSGMLPAIPHVKGGKLRALAVTTRTRSPAAPEVPTMAEAGVPGFDISNWFAYFVPAGTSREIVSKLSTELARVLKLPDVKEKLASQGAETVGDSPEQLGQFVRAESAKYAKLIKASGAKAD
jgi:tripartite-type tricarboxylate transporter receptor subunit TctC